MLEISNIFTIFVLKYQIMISERLIELHLLTYFLDSYYDLSANSRSVVAEHDMSSMRIRQTELLKEFLQPYQVRKPYVIDNAPKGD